MRHAWRADEVAAIKAWLLDDGHSAATIVRLLAKHFALSVSPNAVIGVVHRHGFGGRSKGAAATPRRRRLAPSHAARQAFLQSSFRTSLPKSGKPLPPEPLPAGDNPDDYPHRKQLDALAPADCRWPIGDPKSGPFGFCGARKVDGLPYCEVHARRAYQPRLTIARGLEETGAEVATAIATEGSKETAA